MSSQKPQAVPNAASALASTINLNEDPDKLFRLLESIGTGSYGDVYKVKIYIRIHFEVLYWC
jgi:hypothetical protein